MRQCIHDLCLQFVGILLTAVGVLVELHRDRIEPVNNHLALPTALLIAVGLIIAINALCGMVGTILENPLLLKVVSDLLIAEHHVFIVKIVL